MTIANQEEAPAEKPPVFSQAFVQTERTEEKDMWKGLLILIAAAFLLFVGFLFGSLGTSFKLNTAYSEVIHALAEETKRTLHSKSHDFEYFEKFLNSLPLHGYESNPDELSTSISTFRKNHNPK